MDKYLGSMCTGTTVYAARDIKLTETETKYSVEGIVAISETVTTLRDGRTIRKRDTRRAQRYDRMRYFIESYGCTMNFGEGRMLSEEMAALGYEEVPSPEEADIVILNTCTVVGTTEKRMMDRIADLKRLGKEVVVTGCLAAAQPKRVMIRLPDAPVISPRGYEGFGKMIADRYGVAGPPRTLPVRKDAILPIAQGCLGNCTYCITKIARGNLASYAPEALKREFDRMVAGGASEILVTAQDTACYGRDIGTTLPELLSSFLENGGDFRIRIGMMNPNALLPVCDGLLDVMEDPRVYRFLHIPVQSGSDAVLGRMNRRYTA